MPESKKVLIVEDEADLREALVTVISQAGYTALEAADGRVAVDTAFAEKPDLILLDIQMPVMNGLEALREIRENEWGVGVPIIMLTAQSDIGNLSEAVTIGGMNLEYLTKTDWKLTDVVAKVQGKLG